MGTKRDAEGAGLDAVKKKKKKKLLSKQAAPATPVPAAAPPAPALTAAAPAVAGGGSYTLSDRLNPTHPGFDAALKARWKKMTKKERAAYVTADADLLKARAAAAADISHPFPVDADDHAETAPEAYADVAPVLDAIAAALGKDRGSLEVYDPYFCAGAVKRHLGALGFARVRNECEDFYARAASAGGLPDHDVLLTNPAYSGDHIPRLLDICCATGKPFLLLMPNWVAAKDYYAAAQRRHAPLRAAAYLWPARRYVYWTPQGLRQKKQAHASAAGNRTSPFPSFWYLGLGGHRAAALAALRRAGGGGGGVSLSVAELPASVRPEGVAGSGSGGGGGAGQQERLGKQQWKQKHKQQQRQHGDAGARPATKPHHKRPGDRQQQHGKKRHKGSGYGGYKDNMARLE